MARRSRSSKNPQPPHDPPPRCAVPGCPHEGLHKAPQSKQQLHEYLYLCLEHVREHNQRWDYFSGMKQSEIEAFMKDAVTGHRPTWERMAHIPNAQEQLYSALHGFLGAKRRKTPDAPQLSSKVRKALAVLELEYPYSDRELKNQYKKMVKRTHPDHHPGDRLAAEKFKAITSAYKLLSEMLRADPTLTPES